ncbi:MAG: hypothetical protein M1819_000122 [Sarea resinae]|nr:MAG: hypothetical protein M1819_000122 [Sarea resinae]
MATPPTTSISITPPPLSNPSASASTPNPHSSSASTITDDPTAFTFPPEYSFPPFFTPQPNTTTRLAQLAKWSSLIQAYCRHHRLWTLSLSSALESPLFWNKKLGRRLGGKDARDVLGWMAGREGDERVEWVGGGGAQEKGDVVWVWWRKKEEWATLIAARVEETGQKNTVLTLYELTQGESTRSQGRRLPVEFYGMDSEMLRNSLNVLVKRGKAQVFGSGDELGVKFF